MLLISGQLPLNATTDCWVMPFVCADKTFDRGSLFGGGLGIMDCINKIFTLQCVVFLCLNISHVNELGAVGAKQWCPHASFHEVRRRGGVGANEAHGGEARKSSETLHMWVDSTCEALPTSVCLAPLWDEVFRVKKTIPTCNPFGHSVTATKGVHCTKILLPLTHVVRMVR